MNYAIQFVKNYNRNIKQTKIISSDGQEKTLTLSIDVVRNAYALEVVAEPYVDLRKLGNKLEGATTYESHKQREGVKVRGNITTPTEGSKSLKTPHKG